MTETPVLEGPLHNGAEAVARVVHALHGTRGLLWGGAGLLVLNLVEPAMGRGVLRTLLVAALFALFLVGLFTLPREGATAIRRARRLLHEPHAMARMARRLAWPVLLIVFLLPRVFLGATVDSPNLNPLSGLVLPSMIRRIALLFLFLVLLLPIAYLRSSRRYAPDLQVMRPKDLPREDHSHQARDILLVTMAALLVLWGWLLHPYWHPFTLLQWPPSLASLQSGVAGVARVAFSLTIPVVLYMTMVSHLGLVKQIVRSPGRHHGVLAMALLHVALALLAVVMHARVLLLIVEIQRAPFFT